MTYDTAYLASDYVKYIKAVQQEFGNEAHAMKFVRSLEIRVKIGLFNRSTPDHPDGPLMVLQPWNYGNNDVVRHETAHIILWWSSLEAEIIHEYGEELGWKVIENLCRFAVAFLRITPPMLDEAVEKYGITARAVRHLQKLSGADARTALTRLIYDDPRSCRAGFITSGPYIAEVQQCNWALPFGWLDEAPKPWRWFPDGANVSFFTLNRSQLIGVACG